MDSVFAQSPLPYSSMFVCVVVTKVASLSEVGLCVCNRFDSIHYHIMQGNTWPIE